MAKSSINFQKAKSHSFNHNFRKDKPNYLLPEQFHLGNEFWQHEKSELEIFSDQLSKAKRKGGRIPKFENSRWEAVLNLNKSHNLEDVKKVAEHIEKKFNIIATSISIHRDEGHLENDKPVHNFHAHLNFITYKDGKQNWRKQHIKPSMLSKLQTEVAELLQMERGIIGSKAQRLTAQQFKARAKELATLKELKIENKKLREALQERGANREDYAELEALNRELRERIKAKDLTIDQLKELIYHKSIKYQDGTKATNKDASNFYEKELSEAQETILKLKTTIDTQKSDLSVYRAKTEVLEHKIKELESSLAILDEFNGKQEEDERLLEEVLETKPMNEVINELIKPMR